MTTITAEYRMCSTWDIDDLGIDFSKVENWFIKFNTLYIRFSKNEDYQEFEASSSAEDFDFKYPYEIESN